MPLESRHGSRFHLLEWSNLVRQTTVMQICDLIERHLYVISVVSRTPSPHSIFIQCRSFRNLVSLHGDELLCASAWQKLCRSIDVVYSVLVYAAPEKRKEIRPVSRRFVLHGIFCCGAALVCIFLPESVALEPA